MAGSGLACEESLLRILETGILPQLTCTLPKKTTNLKTRSQQAWRAVLTPQQFHICREGGTEAPFTGQYNDCKQAGIYTCVCCGAELFSSAQKFESGSGWPSFYQACSSDPIRELQDTSHGMLRTEVRCKQCDAHLGHVFPDGPEPTGLRYCINSTALKLCLSDIA